MGGHQFTFRDLVDLSKYNSERYSHFAHPVYKIDIDGLRLVPGIQQNKSRDEVSTFFQISLNHPAKRTVFAPGCCRETVSRQINEIPLLVDKKVIDGLRFSRFGRR